GLARFAGSDSLGADAGSVVVLAQPWRVPTANSARSCRLLAFVFKSYSANIWLRHYFANRNCFFYYRHGIAAIQVLANPDKPSVQSVHEPSEKIDD
ncbi:MAG: hypothetical protein EBX55_05345, partial [Betaproteobacteria bacterium]|nr:hypothetical protein [Betaproteobacteria bacterium]